MTPLYAALSNKPKELTWGSPQADAFQQTKEALATATLLAFPDPGKPLLLTTDASKIAIGAVLEQVIQGQPCRLATDPFVTSGLTTHSERCHILPLLLSLP
ncbi:hypothetical protein Pmani_008743 [Petrolisthes manimaculis]|uniref:Reverse transcriptase/retrotransposon-derived protein RNase H-like domain-containing protein n=1 Tax=Petrolisthes manimaculis TaxID=1843537 RepID=A0AAE1Q7Z1_9EUCA|nr:hypothetical protein Pmani_008743 [Petrolisthes manimaculis]